MHLLPGNSQMGPRPTDVVGNFLHCTEALTFRKGCRGSGRLPCMVIVSRQSIREMS